MKCQHCYEQIQETPWGHWIAADADVNHHTIVAMVCEWGRTNIDHRPMPDLNEVSA